MEESTGQDQLSRGRRGVRGGLPAIFKGEKKSHKRKVKRALGLEGVIGEKVLRVNKGKGSTGGAHIRSSAVGR